MISVTLRISQSASEYEVSLIKGEPWNPGAVIDSDKVPATVWNSIALEDARQAASDSSLLEEAGRILGRILFPEKIGLAWDGIGTEFRTYLDIDSNLDDLPWECALFADDLGVFRDRHRPVLRFVKPTKQKYPSPNPDRLRVLAIISVNPGDSTIDAGEEIKALRETIRPFDRHIELQVLPNPTPTAINTELKKRPSVLHFIGHGDAGVLKLWNGTEYDAWTQSDIKGALSNYNAAPNLTVLNCCRGRDGKAEVGGGSLKLAWSIARTFADMGSGAIIAMQGPVSGESCRNLTKGIYEKIASGGSLDAALAETRFELFSQPGLKAEAHLPALLVTRAPDPIIDLKIFADPSEWMSCEIVTPPLKQFVDRESSRWDLLDRCVKPELHHLTVLTGESGIGKSWLLAWCMDGWLRRRKCVRYVALRKCSDWLTFVRRVKDGSGGFGKVSVGLPQEVTSDLNWRLNELAKGGTIQNRPADAPATPDQAGNWADLKTTAPEMPAAFLPVFVDVLDGGIQNVPVVLVLDELMEGEEHFPKEHFQYLAKYFFPAVMRSKRVSVVLAMSDPERERYGDSIPLSATLAASPFGASDQEGYVPILYELRYQKRFPEEFRQNLAKRAQELRTGTALRRLVGCYHTLATGEAGE